MDANITAMAEIFAPILTEIEYNPVDGTYNLWGVIASEPYYTKQFVPKFVVVLKKNYMATSLGRMQNL